MTTQYIPNDLQQFVRNEIASGKFRSEEEVVTVALRLLQERERKKDALLDDLEFGINQLDEGKAATVMDEKAHHEFFQDIEMRGRERLADKGQTS